jgi:hypothetical protein
MTSYPELCRNSAKYYISLTFTVVFPLRLRTDEASSNVTTTKVHCLLAVCLGTVQSRTSHFEDRLVCFLDSRHDSVVDSICRRLGRVVDHFLEVGHLVCVVVVVGVEEERESVCVL